MSSEQANAPHDIVRHSVPLLSGSVLQLFVNRTSGLVCLDIVDKNGMQGNEFVRKILNEKELLSHVEDSYNLPKRTEKETLILTGSGTIERYHLQNGLKWPIGTPSPTKEEKVTYFLESIDSEILEDDYEEGEKDFTGCGLPMINIGKKFPTKKLMLEWIENNYSFTGFEEHESPGIMATSKTVADHSSAQNGGWFDPTEEELKLWKEGKMKLYTENVTIKYHTFKE